MSRSFRLLAAAGLVALAAGGSESRQSAKPTSPAAAPDAKKVDAATAANVSGKGLFEGTPPPATSIKMASDPACEEANKGGDLKSETYVVENGGLDNVFVYVKDGLGNKFIFDTTTEPG